MQRWNRVNKASLEGMSCILRASVSSILNVSLHIPSHVTAPPFPCHCSRSTWSEYLLSGTLARLSASVARTRNLPPYTVAHVTILPWCCRCGRPQVVKAYSDSVHSEPAPLPSLATSLSFVSDTLLRPRFVGREA